MSNSVLNFQASNHGSLGVGSPGFSYSLPSSWAFDQSQSASPGFGITASADIYGGLTGTISATTGMFSISYPISVDAIFASSVADGQTVTIDTSDYSVDGAALSLIGPGIGANLDLSLGGSLSLSAPGWAGISAALNLDIPLSLSQEFDSPEYGSITIASPTSFSANSGSPIDATGFLPELSASGESTNFLSAALSLANLATALPLSGDVSLLGQDFNYDLLAADLRGGLALGQDVSFDPTGVSVSMTYDGQTETEPLGQTFTFNAPSSGSGTMNISATYTLEGNIVTQTGIVGSLGLNLSALEASGLGISFGPLVSVDVPDSPWSTGLQSWNSATTEFAEDLTNTEDYTVAYGPNGGSSSGGSGGRSPTPTFKIVSSPTVSESAGQIVFTIVETGALSQSLTAYVSTVQNWNGSGVYNTSTPGSDVSTNYYYDGLNTIPITFAATSATSSSQQISIAINPVGLTTGSETFGFEVQEMGSSGELDPDPAASTSFTIENQPSATPGPTISTITSSPGSASVVTAGHSITFTVTFSAPVTVTLAGGPPLLTLNDNETASYTAGSGTNALTFVYNVSPGDRASDLQVTGLTIPNGSAIINLAGHAAVTTGAAKNTGLQINTAAPTVTITTTGGLTASAAQTISGTVDTADAGTTVTIFDGANNIGTAVVASNGTWTAHVTLSAPGSNALVAKDTNKAGNTGGSNQIFYTLDTTSYGLSPSAPTATENQGSLVFTLTRTNNTSAETVFVQTNDSHGTSNPKDKYFEEDNLVPVVFAQYQEAATFALSINDIHATSGTQTFGVSIYPSLSVSGTPLAATTFTIDDTDTNTGSLTGTIETDDTVTGTTTISSPLFIEAKNSETSDILQNDGVIDIDSGGFIGGDNDYGTISNQAGSVININTADLSAYTIDVTNVVNNGSINVLPGKGNVATICTANGGISDSGDINVLSGTLQLHMFGANSTASLNASGISVAASASLEFTGAGTFTIAGGSYNVAGTTIIGNSTYEADVVFGAGTDVNVGGNWILDGSLDFSAATISGTFSSLDIEANAYSLNFGANNVTINNLTSYLFTVSDSGTITLTGSITSDATWSGGGTVINEGTITPPADWQPGEITSGETFVNYGVVNDIISDAGSIINNETDGVMNLESQTNNGVLNNYGLINFAGTGSGYAQVYSTLNNSGTIRFSAASGWTLNDGGASNASGFILGTGITLFFGGSASADTYTITGGTFDGGGNLWVLSGAKVEFAESTQVDIGFQNDGTIEVANGSTLTLKDALTGSGSVVMDAGTTLALAAPQGFANTISGFASGDTVDLVDIAATDASINGGDQLVITDAGTRVATLQMTGTYSGPGLQFLLASDGKGGTEITLGVPSAPSLSAGAIVTFADSTTPTAVTLDAPLAVISGGSSSLAGATVSIISGFLTGDVLAATTAGTNITANYNTSTGVLSLSGTDSLSNYQSVLQSVTFDSVPDAQDNGAESSRTIAWTVTDGTRTSTVVNSTVNIIDAAPVVAGLSSPTFDMNATSTPVTLAPNLTLSDIDNTTLTAATVSIGSGYKTGDLLGITTTGTAITVVSDAKGILKLAGVDTLADYQAVLRSITFTTTNAALNNRFIVWTVNDGERASALLTNSVTMDPPPTVTSVTVSPLSGDVLSGNDITITLKMSEVVNVVGTPTLALSDGGVATYASGTGTTSLLFRYQVGAESTTDLRITGIGQSAGNTIADLAGNPLSSTLSADLKLDVNVFTFTHTTSGGGIWNASANWSPSGVPGAGETALITKAGTYTVSSTENNSVSVVDTAAAATLVVGGGTVFAATGGTGLGANAGKIKVADGATLELGGTFVNNGSITLGGSASATDLEVDGTALTLTGGGKVTLSDNSNNAIVADGSAATLTNVNNTIAGGGTLGDADLTLVNQAGGIIDGDGVGNALKLIAATSNSGVLEATTSQGLVIAGDVDNTKTIEAAGKNAAVAVTSTTISDGAAGLILASGSGAHVELDDATISGGKLETSGTGALIETVSGSTDNVIGGGTIVAGSLVEVLSGTALTLSGGTIGAGATVETASSGTLTVSGSITNSGTLFASGAGSMVDVAGVVSGGGAVKVGNGVVDIQGAGSESVAFMSGGTGGLQLDDASAYTGKITGFGADTTQFIDFTGINSAGATVSYAPNSSHPTSGGVLTISSGGHTVASITMVGKYTTANFLLGSDSGGHLEITDPPGAAPQPGGTPWLAGDGQGANVALLANYMAASFIAAAGGHDGASIAGALQAASQPLLLAQPHTG